MGNTAISVYIPDNKYVKYLEKKSEIQSEVRQLVKEKLDEDNEIDKEKSQWVSP